MRCSHLLPLSILSIPFSSSLFQIYQQMQWNTNLLMSVVGIEVCRNVGVNVETYYEFIGDNDLHNLFMEIGI